jgi:hypothetical protein
MSQDIHDAIKEQVRAHYGKHISVTSAAGYGRFTSSTISAVKPHSRPYIG